MLSSLSSKYYWNENLFKLENEKIFERLWIFACIDSELSQNNSYLLRRFGETEIIVQKINDEIVALENTCPHRLNSIHQDPVGNRPLVCKYHGWSFNSDGTVKSIPSEKSHFLFSRAEKRKACLKAFHVKKVGRLIFVNLDQKPIPIEKQISKPMLRDLERVSNSFDTSFEKRIQRRKFNWKLIQENLRDEMHLRFVHPTTITTWVDFDSYPKYPLRFRPHPISLRNLSFGGPEGKLAPAPHQDWHSKVEKWCDKNLYYNWLVYPNFHLSSSSGYQFSIEYHHPISAGETEVHIYMLTTKRTVPDFDNRAVLKGAFAGGEVILEEDHRVVESVQKQLFGKNSKALLGAYDKINLRNESWYLRRLHWWKNFSPLFYISFVGSIFETAYHYVRQNGPQKLLVKVKDLVF